MNPVRAARPAGLVLLLTGLLAGCGGGGDGDDGGGDEPPTLARELVEQQVRTQLGEEVGREPEEVSCPADLTGEVGEEMRCTLTDSGTDLGVTLGVTAVEGSEVDFDIQVDDAAG